MTEDLIDELQVELTHALIAADVEATHAAEWRERCLKNERRATILEANVKHLRERSKMLEANHANHVERARMLIERPDMPIERVKAYKAWGLEQERLREAKLDARRWAACLHMAKRMEEGDLEFLFVLEVDKYIAENGL